MNGESIEVLGLSNRWINALKRGGIETVNDIIERKDELLTIRTIGTVGYLVVVDAMKKEYGIDIFNREKYEDYLDKYGLNATDRGKHLFLVSIEGYYEGYGSYTYAVGIFDDYDKAEKALEKAKYDVNRMLNISDVDGDIKELILNEYLPVKSKHKEYGYMSCFTDVLLGGYSE